MPKQRKTHDVEKFRLLVNQRLALRDESAVGTEGRREAAILLENVLWDTGNYKGFRYTDGANGTLDESRRWYL